VLPLLTPLITPVAESIEAIEASDVLHTPPVVVLDRVDVAPTQMLVVPVITAGVGGAVTTDNAKVCEVDPQVLVTV
jgi:hypothetical protein